MRSIARTVLKVLINIRHISTKGNLKGITIFFGVDYKNLLKVRAKVGSNLIDIDYLIQEANLNKRKLINSFMDEHKSLSHNSLYYLMTHFGNKNNRASNFFDLIMQLSALKSFYNENVDTIPSLNIVCEDWYSLICIHKFFKKVTNSSISLFSYFSYLQDNARYILKGVVFFLRQINKLMLHKFEAWRSDEGFRKIPHGEIFLLHQCLDDFAISQEETLNCRYFSNLPDFFNEKKIHLYRIPWLFNNQVPTKKIYQKIRRVNCLVPEDYLSIKDYIKIITDCFLTIKSIPNRGYFEGIDISDLLIREKLKFAATSFNQMPFWKTYRALPYWSKNLTKVNLIDVFEMDVPERFLPYFFRHKFEGKFKHIGYFHSLLSKDYLACNLSKEDIRSSTFPDKIITNGNIAKEFLLEQGIPEEKVKSGPALRQNFRIIKRTLTNSKLAIFLPLDVDASIELLDKVNQNNNFLNKNKISILLKIHPLSDFRKILKKLGWKKLPDRWDVTQNEINEILEKTMGVLVLDSASIYDALIVGCPVIPISRSLKPNWNNADLIVKKFPIVKSVSSDQFEERINELSNNNEMIIKQFNIISEYVMTGLNKPNISNMLLFTD